ncbi:hypothetical protein [Rhodoblastus sp.]|uniref:hypothetical protein n=1 Tax=Rhodoblastus sp. TaxID=1962975 RepID=UPI003F9BA273
MEPSVRIGTTKKKSYSPSRRNGYGFDVEKRGSGVAASEWLSVLELIYSTEAESKAAEEGIRQAIGNPVHVQGSGSPF